MISRGLAKEQVMITKVPVHCLGLFFVPCLAPWSVVQDLIQMKKAALVDANAEKATLSKADWENAP